MVPATVRFVETLPQLPGYKIDVSELERLAAEPSPRPTLQPQGGKPDASDVAAVIAYVWNELLGRDSFASGERWDDAGGDSLKMLQLAYGIERLTERPLTLDAFWPEMRGAELVERLRETATAPRTESARTVVLCPGLRGDEPKLASFRKLVGDDVRFFLPAYTAWETLVRNAASFDAIVEDVVLQIRAKVRDRPLIIAGYSFGGKVAHEAARRLVLEGDDVAFLAILDTNLTANERIDGDAPSAQSGLDRLKRDVRMHGIRRTLAIRAGYRLAVYAYRSPGLRRFAARRPKVPLPRDVAFAFQHYMVWFVRAALAKAWRPATQPACTTLFRSASYGESAPRDLGWSAHTPDLTIEDIGGTHDSMIVDGQGEELANKLREALEAHFI